MRKLIRIIAVIILIAGIGFFTYPIVLKIAFNMQADKAIVQFESIITDELPTNNALPYAELRKAMFAYNEELYLSGQSGLIDQLSYEVPDFLLSDYGINSDILVILLSPKLTSSSRYTMAQAKKIWLKGQHILPTPHFLSEETIPIV